MSETWLKVNRRPLIAALAVPLVMIVLGLSLLAGRDLLAPAWRLDIVGGVLAVIGILGMARILWEMRRPRVARRGDQLLIYLRPGRPFELPLDVVECFLLGQGPALLAGNDLDAETRTLIIHLAQSAEEWKQREAEPRLGNWCGGQITIRGTWCEPLDLALVNRLNERLADAHNDRHSRAVAS